MHDSDTSTPGGRLRWARKRAGYDIAADAARRCNVREVTYNAHEADRGVIKHLPLYARVFKVSLEWLMTGKGDPDAYVDEETARIIQFLPQLNATRRQQATDYIRFLLEDQARKDTEGKP